MSAAASSIGLPIVDYQLATANQAQLMAQFLRTPQYAQDLAAYQAGVGKITTVDQFLNNYKVLKVALAAYNMQDIIDQKGLLKKLLTQDPTNTSSLVQKLGKPNYVSFARAFWSLSSDGGAGLNSAASINMTSARYTNAQFQQWLADRDNDPTLAKALAARTTLQDAVNITDVGALFAQYQKTPDVQRAADYYKRNIVDVNSPADLLADSKLLNFALIAYGIDPNSVSADTVQKLLTELPTLSSSVAANNPAYQAFANAFLSLHYDGGAGVAKTDNINDVVSRYQQRTFAQALTANTEGENAELFGAKGAAQIAQILSDAKAETGISLAASYYGSHLAAATTAKAFAADAQLVSVALEAYGLDPVSSTTLQRLLTEDPNDADSLAHASPQYAAFAGAFSYAAALGARGRNSNANIADVQQAYEAHALQAILQTDITQAASQATRNTKVRESADAPLNLYQMLGDANVSAVLLGAYNQPATVGALDPDRQVEVITHAGFAPESINSPKAIDALIRRYLANVSTQSTPASPLASLFQPTQPGDIVTLDFTPLLNLSSGASADLSAAPTAYLLNVFV
jgi:hypothetical protein